MDIMANLALGFSVAFALIPLDLVGFKSTLENAFLRHRFLKKHKAAQRRFKVEKTRGSVVSGLQEAFSKLLGGGKNQTSS